MRRKKTREIILGVVAVALLAYELFVLRGENYYYVSLGILLLGLIGFFAHFEEGRPSVLLLTVIASLCGLAIVGRIAFFFLPQVKPIVAVVILAGVAFDGEIGFVTGAVSAFVSNFYFGQGPWTPFQMFALGAVGFVAGILFFGRKNSRVVVALYGLLATLILYGGIVDINTIYFTSMEPSLAVATTVYLSALPFNLVLGIATAVFLFLLYRPIVGKLKRLQKKYCLIDKEMEK